MIAIGARYHAKCLVSLYNKVSRVNKCEQTEGPDAHLHGIALAELVAYIEDFLKEADASPVFKLSHLVALYQERLEQLGASSGTKVHSSRLKNRLLAVIPHLTAHTEGRDVLLTSDHFLGAALKKACDCDNDAMYLAKAASVVRREMFTNQLLFTGSFQRGSQQNSVPPSLLALVRMIQEGPNIEQQSKLASGNSSRTPSALSISQLLMFNSVRRAPKPQEKTDVNLRHRRERETPLTLYIALKLHGETRKRNLVDTFYSLGMCVSYDRLLQLSSDLANGVCKQFEADNVVCPPKMRHGLFTTAAVDNIDHNPSSMTAQDSFHGTGISLMQHPSHAYTGVDRSLLLISKETTSTTKAVVSLPTFYSSVPPAALKTKEFIAPEVAGYEYVRSDHLQAVNKATSDEKQWMETVQRALTKGVDGDTPWLSWAAYHASRQQELTPPPPPAINALMPLFPDSAHSVGMIKHSMNVVSAAVRHLNPGQVPILTADQPLFVLAKQVQWSWPTTHGEDSIVMMLGGLHIEMAILKLIGEWLEDSGWTNALTDANIASSGTSDSFIRAHHVTSSYCSKSTCTPQ
ncbi:uncharacterized protein LOC119733071 [Patiria miniata]|uniref:Uncharacterized protein n=1 Tax=Patiria miniata TaxID=46514 RepID=A0A914AF32_PATMI|nr:uncharacterized protein LOC119733071 [Patiria miniata]